MSRPYSLVWLLLPAAAFAPAAPALKDPPPKEPPIIGEWLRVGHTHAGAAMEPDGQPHHQMFRPDGEWEYTYGGHQGAPGHKSYVVDARQKPATIDIHPNPPGPPQWRGIYKVEGDTLTLCLVTGDRERPKTFESSADQQTTVWVFKRVQPKD